MKKKYTSPLMKQENAECCQMLTASGVNGNGIGYGGIDNGGDLEPSVKEFLWDGSDDSGE